METTRHFVATLYVVQDGETLLHDHDTLGMWLPPGGHVDRDELPHRTALREAREETGLDVELVCDETDLSSPTARELPGPRNVLLEDIDVCDGAVGHQHVDFVYYGRATDRDLSPDPGEQPAADWEWFDEEALTAADGLQPDVVENGRRAIRAVRGSD